MSKQTYANHVRYYAPHHFVFYPLLIIAIIWSFIARNKHADQQDIWLAIIVVLFFVGLLSFMTRQHYGLKNQDRIVRIEMRFRYFVLTGKRFELLEPELTFPQIAALRFSSDAELPLLVDKTIREKLTPTDVKKSIQDWNPDLMRL